jgi:hypothetical protein
MKPMLWLRRRPARLRTCLLTAMVTLLLGGPDSVFAQDKPANAGEQVAKAVGVIKSIQADSITLVDKSGTDVIAKLVSATRILHVLPGEKDLKNATAMQEQDLQAGDSVRVRGQTAADGHTIIALEVIVLKQSDLAAKQQRDRDDWQKRGVAGNVTKVDAAAATVTISLGGMSANRPITIHIAKDTVLRRYAPGSAKIEDAKPAPFDQIRVGDQLNARGTRSPDGNEVAAEDVIFGPFPYIEGIIKAIDAANNTVTVQDPTRKTAVVVKVTPDSLLLKLSPEMAQRIAAGMKKSGGAAGGSGDQSGANGQGATPNGSGAQPSASAESQGARGARGGPGGNGPPDIQRMLSRLPKSTLADLQKEDTVMIVSAEGVDAGTVTAIKLLAGVDAILRAAPNRSASSLLSGWSLGAPGGEGEATPQ